MFFLRSSRPRAFSGLIGLLILLQAAVAARPEEALSRQTLRDDLAYYERLAAKNRFSANDRIYHLYRLKHKYQDSGIELPELRKEILHWELVRLKAKEGRSDERGTRLATTGAAPAKPSPPKAAPTAPAAASRPDETAPQAEPAAAPVSAPIPPPASSGDAPELVDLDFSEGDNTLKVVLRLSRPVVPEAKRIDDPENPLLWVDLPGTRAAFPVEDVDRRWDEGPLVSAQTLSPDPHTLRVQLEMRGSPSYRVLRTGQEVHIDFKAASQQSGPPLWQETDAATPRPAALVNASAAGNTVLIMGRVEWPGDYAFSEGMTAMDLLTMAGGAVPGAQLKEVKIFRQVGSRRNTVPVNLGRVMRGRAHEDVSLKPGDIMLVPQKSQSDAVTGFLPWLYLATFLTALVIVL